MSTRCTVHFKDEYEEVIIYRHSDGYPSSVLPNLEDFFKAVEVQTDGDTRFGDASYLAAKFVVWLAAKFARRDPLNFLSVGVVSKDPNDIEYRYTVRCHQEIPQEHPVVVVEEL